MDSVGSPHLLTTKFHIPLVRPNHISRQRLTDLLNQGLEKSLILVSAPAGYGKTTLVSQWLKKAKIASSWLSLDSGDNDPIRFLQYLLKALVPIAPAIEGELSGMLNGIQPSQVENVVNLMVNELAAHSTPFVFVLDDFHIITSEAVLDILAYLLDHLPPQMHLVILTRSDPPLPLSRMRVRGQLLDIRVNELRFTQQEITDFLTGMMKLPLTAGDLSAMEERTEGWIASLQLAALSMQGREDIHNFVVAFTGSHHYVMDYLADEVLKFQSAKVNSFLLETSILDRMCAGLCDALVDADHKENDGSQAMLETLEELNLFVIPLDDEQKWYRYHHLFADVLKKRLQKQFPAILPELHLQASRWYERNGLISESIQYAISAGDSDRAAQLIEDNGCLLLMSGEVATLLGWTDAIEFQLETHPWLAIQKAWALGIVGELDRVEPTLQEPERLLSPLESTDEVRTMQGTIAAARAHCANSQGDTVLAVKYAKQALELLPKCSSISRSIRSVATSLLGDASWINGDLQQAISAYTEAAKIARGADNLHMAIISDTNIAEILLEMGQLHASEISFQRSLQLAIRPDGERSPLAAKLFMDLSRIAYEQNRLADANQFLHLCIGLCQKWGDIKLEVVANTLQARLENALGNRQQAQESIREAQNLTGDTHLSPHRSRQVKNELVRAWLVLGEHDKANQLIKEENLSDKEKIPYQMLPEYMAFLRLLSSVSDRKAAKKLSNRLLQIAETSGRLDLQIEIFILQAMILQEEKDTEAAVATLDKALSLAKPEGYARVFLDEGEPMTRLLCQVQSRHGQHGYASDLLAKIEKTPGMSQPSMQLLAEPLTAREIEVFKLIETGCSNQDISNRLFISITTVKRHISNIYTKLGVNSRTQAIAIGKELKIFS